MKVAIAAVAIDGEIFEVTFWPSQVDSELVVMVLPRIVIERGYEVISLPKGLFSNKMLEWLDRDSSQDV